MGGYQLDDSKSLPWKQWLLNQAAIKRSLFRALGNQVGMWLVDLVAMVGKAFTKHQFQTGCLEFQVVLPLTKSRQVL